jgi:UDP-N-acetyl-alpha-D-muramoyl-L-alanyl-L-glutamate epimerase
MTDPRRFDPGSFDPGTFGTFRVVGRAYDPASRTITLRYALDDRVEFTETVTFETPPGPDADRDGPTGAGFERALLHLHVAAGTSYYKTAAPGQVVVEGESLSAAELDMYHRLYDEGLREFAVTNGLPVPRPVAVVAGRGEAGHPLPAAGTLRPGLLVPIGGGKDSMVLIEAVRRAAPRLLAVNPHPLVRELADQAGLDLVVVRRRLDPGLAALHAAGALNGHVPVTAIVSLVAVVGAFVHGYDTVAMAVERSASEETVTVGGVAVNHQYSKSREFELLLADVLRRTVAPELTYGSALRPYAELAIARAFARLTQYHGTFCSCNAAFRQGADAGDRWCGHCPKCRFVGLMLAPFLEPGALTAIIGTDMFADPEQVPGFAALMSDVDKPFECVGERRESAAAMRLLASRPGWRDTAVVSALAAPASALVDDADVAALLVPDDTLAIDAPDVAAAVARLMERP